MAGSFVHDEPRDLSALDVEWGAPASPCLGPMAPAAYGVWSPALSPMTPSVGAYGGRPSCLKRSPQLPLAGQPANPAYGRLQIFCPDRAERSRGVGGKTSGCDGCFLMSPRCSFKESSRVQSPSKYELAAVTALCKTPLLSRSSPRRRTPKKLRFPAAASFIPSRHLPAGADGLAVVCNTPLSTIRRPNRTMRRSESPARAALKASECSQKARLRPFQAVPRAQPQWETRGLRACRNWLHREPPESPPREAGESVFPLLPAKGVSASFRWRSRQPEGATCGEPLRSPDASVYCGAATVPPVMGRYQNRFCMESMPSRSPLYHGEAGYSHVKAVEAYSSMRHPPISFASRSRGILPMTTLPESGDQKATEDSQAQAEDPRADVVTVYSTDRFWALMETLVELQKGPTSLHSSSVTFDSVLLPGGELQYSLIEQGSFGKVFVGSHLGTKVAIKVPVESMLRTDPAGVMERTLNEWRILSVCQHPNVVSLVGGIVHGPFDVWLVTKLAKGSDLHSRKYSRDPQVQRFISPQNGLYMCRQLAAVVAYLHTPIPGKKPVVVHRDIKPENVLIADDWRIQLCDFGDAEASPDGRVSRISGATWFYAPAELLRCSPVESMMADSGAQLPPFDEKWDIWSMGCVFHEMLGFINPMHVHISSRDSPSIIYQKLKSKAIAGALVPEIAEEIRGIARAIILRCLNPDPRARPSAVEVLQMWSARDEDILKDIHLRPASPQANMFMGSSCSSEQCSSGAVYEPQQLLGDAPSSYPAHDLPCTRGSADWEAGNVPYGQSLSSSNEHVSTGAAVASVQENRASETPWSTMPSKAPTQLPLLAERSPVPKEGARFVPQQVRAAAQWQ